VISKLKPCPFCGVVPAISGSLGRFRLIHSCDAIRTNTGLGQREDLIKVWNNQSILDAGKLMANAPLVVEMSSRIAELENLTQMIIDAESADGSLIPIMYHAWLHKAKALKEQVK